MPRVRFTHDAVRHHVTRSNVYALWTPDPRLHADGPTAMMAAYDGDQRADVELLATMAYYIRPKGYVIKHGVRGCSPTIRRRDDAWKELHRIVAERFPAPAEVGLFTEIRKGDVIPVPPDTRGIWGPQFRVVAPTPCCGVVYHVPVDTITAWRGGTEPYPIVCGNVLNGRGSKPGRSGCGWPLGLSATTKATSERPQVTAVTWTA